MPQIERPFYPIVYIRGFAMRQAEIEETSADPYMGFNLGASKLRQLASGSVVKHIFESPLVRLMKDHDYRDVFLNGAEAPPESEVHPKSVWIYRYYEGASKEIGTGELLEIEDYGDGLFDFIESIRDRIASQESIPRADVKVHLIAHSMGGLIARCYLQSVWPKRKPAGEEKPPVDKVFTYATPHGGIDLRLIGNVPEFLTKNQIDNFNEKRMREYLGLPKKSSTAPPVHSLNGAFDASRFFSLIGTNHRDYRVAGGLARFAVGPMSDGLVQIKNAYVDRSPRAFVHRSHSGHYGIVNSEEGYQNLRRFLFGDVRVDARLRLDALRHPEKIREKLDAGKAVDFGLHVETVLTVRGSRWQLHRRLVGEESAIFVDANRVGANDPFHLFSAFLLDAARVDKGRQSLGFSLELGILVPEYEVDGFLFLEDHFPGGYLFRDKITLELTVEPGKAPRLDYGFDQFTPNRTTREADRTSPADSRWDFTIPVTQRHTPGLDGELLLTARRWS